MKIESQIFDIHGIMKCMIDRKDLAHNVRSALRRSRVVALIGPRQCGRKRKREASFLALL